MRAATRSVNVPIAMTAPGTFRTTLDATESGVRAGGGELQGTLDDGVSEGSVRGASPLPERYEDLGRIAAGASGEVRRVRDRSLNRVLALKLLRFEHLHEPGVRARFEAEAEVTAGLQHPGIVAIHDRGELADGRLWFTMQEVRGRTLGAVIEEIHAHKSAAGFAATPSGWTFRRAVDAFSRIAQAVGYAHRRGVVHRDLKPENLMVGELGEALVMDWGLARRIGVLEGDVESGSRAVGEESISFDGETMFEGDAQRTREGDILGTPAYMPPEQAMGRRSLHGPQSDVYSLGAILYHLLAGQHPYSGAGMFLWRQVQAGAPAPLAEVTKGGPPLPEELLFICEKAMRREIEARYPDASALAVDVVAFLDGARRREQALAIVEKVRSLEPLIAGLRTKKAALEGEARRMLEGIKPFEPVELKAPAWELEDEAGRLGREAALRETEWLEGVHGALSVEPDLGEAHAALATHYKERLLEAERAARGEDAIRFETLLRAHDRGQCAGLLRGEGALTLVTDPPGASVALYRYVEERRRLVPRFVEEIGPTPIRERPTQKGSYLCVIRAPGRAEVRYPVLIERGGHWDGVPPGETDVYPIPLPSEGELEPDEVYVPAGWCWIGGDPEAPDSLPSRRIWIDGFVIGRFPVTSSQYLSFLNALVEAGLEPEAVRACPRRELGAASADEQLPIFHRGPDGRFVLPPDWAPEQPIVLVDWRAASAYATWRGRETGRPVRLPNELEWENAARGADGRFLPWGNHLEATFFCALESHEGTPMRTSVTSYSTDESPHGVRGLAGNVRDWCLNVWRLEGPPSPGGRLQLDPADALEPDFRAIRGGTWGSSMVNGRAAARFGGRPERWTLAVGIRTVRSFPRG